jgi:hypothetical protein
MGTIIDAVERFKEKRQPKLLHQVRVRQADMFAWFIGFLCDPYSDPHFGEQGTLTAIDREQDSSELYTVLFKKDGKYTVYSYSREELEFL